ncbi:hypothetical protein TSH7_05545 [Azospirillum sp. TSH7]|uniref:hypothetical protein n=1 Tax=unclassified Azospirillum TaxID=2630922 RepID=UPI000D61EB6D|nr:MULTISPECIES: hypothetical protein [unclassified Azospirillum]PWC66604.1 hypothetical protein TSH7_05545 [Azospirillum sp. TSH7]PWC70467.1 hypothetical protein TSH20_05990 [Azospirillum sp. TSH20]
MSWLSRFSGGNKEPGGTKAAAEPRKERPSSLPKIVIDHHDYVPEEFVLGSFRIRPYDGDLIAKQKFDFRLQFDIGGDPVDVSCMGIVVKLTAEAGLVARYQSPQPFYERKLVDYMKALKGL